MGVNCDVNTCNWIFTTKYGGLTYFNPHSDICPIVADYSLELYLYWMKRIPATMKSYPFR